MDFLAGTRLSVLAVALMALAAAAAVHVALSGELGRTASSVPAPGEPSAEELLAGAGAAEREGDVTSALAYYRAAVMRKPQLADRRSPEFLGPSFEGKVREWALGLKGGKIAAGPTALPDASYLFRRMYGGCG